MQKILLTLLFMGFITQVSFAQDVTILDHETTATTSTFQFFAGAGNSLEGVISNVIANPNASGINTSSMVGEFLKNTDSPDWGGGFSDPSMALDFSTGSTEVCMKVHMDHVGPILLKLEMGTAADWEQQQSNTLINEWEEVCWTIDGVALGQTYNRLTLFFDFGSVVTTNQIYYFDDVIVKGGTAATAGDITFSVNMNNYTGTFTTPHVSGSFNGWSGTSNPMTDANLDGIWEATVAAIPAGPIEYKFTLDDWAVQEEFNPWDGCTVTNGGYTNRSFMVNGNESTPIFCFNSCYNCGDAVNITFNLGASLITPSAEGLFIAGGGNFGAPGEFPLADPDGDEVWSITVERPVGFSSFYTFTNGACGDFSCKENIAGLPCADPNNFNDRFLPAVMSDTTLNTCFGECTEDTNCMPPQIGNVSFSVDMNDYAGGAFTTVHVSGSFNGWSGTDNPMDDSDGDGVWTANIPLSLGDIEYKFTISSSYR